MKDRRWVIVCLVFLIVVVALACAWEWRGSILTPLPAIRCTREWAE